MHVSSKGHWDTHLRPLAPPLFLLLSLFCPAGTLVAVYIHLRAVVYRIDDSGITVSDEHLVVEIALIDGKLGSAPVAKGAQLRERRTGCLITRKRRSVREAYYERVV